MEELVEEIVYVKSEQEDPVEYPLPTIEVIDNTLDGDISIDTQRLNQYCRMCLREWPTLFPLMSRFRNVMIPEMIEAVTAICINFQDDLPKMVCTRCLVRLDYAYNIRKEFGECHRVLRNLAKSKVSKLWECLKDHQKGIREPQTETRSEELLREHEYITRKRKKESIKCAPLETPENVTGVSLNTEQDEIIVEVKFEDTETVEEFEREESHIADETENPGTWELESDEVEIDITTKKKRKNNSRKSRLTKILNYEVLLNESHVDPNKCYICQEVFSDVNDLELHLPNHIDMVPYSCDECKGTCMETKPIATVIMVHRHFRMHAGSVLCPECPYRCYKGYCMYSHLQRYHQNDPNEGCTCETCGYKTKNKKSLENHMRMHKNVDEGRYTCSYCAKKFATNARLQRHERTHTNERPYGCRYCCKSFTNETTLRGHERSHTGEKGYRCEQCGKGNPTKNALNKHMETVHKLEVAKPDQQNRQTRNYNYVKMDVHIKCTHEGCEFEATSRSQYYQHRALHTMKFQCPRCDLRFPTKQRLDMHEFVHTNVKQYCCDVCGKSFRFRNSFTEHMANHNGVRTHTCKICNLSFVRERNLKEHMRKHSDVLGYKCRHCGKQFRYRADLSKHERTHSNPKTLTKEEIDVDSSDDMDVITERFDEENLTVEYLDE